MTHSRRSNFGFIAQFFGWLFLGYIFTLSTAAQGYPGGFFHALRWRMIGPYRGGRTRAACGVPSEPNVFYIGAVNGGVWKTTDYGHTWQPIFNHEPTGSIGAIAVAPSNPNIIYVGSGEGLQRPDLSVGDGMYKSTDGGQTWSRIGLRDTEQIPQIAVDPKNANIVFVAALGHPYGPNRQRGIFRTMDGGRTWQKVLYINRNTGGSDVEINPQSPNIVYAGLWEARQAPWENGQWEGTHGGLFESTDGGSHWRKLTNGLPPGVVQAAVAIAPSRPNRLYASIASKPRQLGIYRSDNGGRSWRKITNDPRPAERIGGGDLALLTVDPLNPNIVYSDSIVTWKSNDGGKAWTGIRGAPGGDDYQHIWINPNNPQIMLIASDQGAIITVNGGRSWSSWYNQPTAQLYHVATDNAFPYDVCSGQQDSGSVCIASRGNGGEITFRDWHPVGAEEYADIVPDPLDANYVVGGKLTLYNRKTTQAADIAPLLSRGKYNRVVRTAPIAFSPVNPHLLFYGTNVVWESANLGQSWRRISPDLTRKSWPVPANVGVYRSRPTAKPTERGVVYAISPSPLDVNLIWACTDDGQIQVTANGGRSWNNVTPPQLQPWAKVSALDAGHFNRGTAYAAINTFRLDDLRPHIFRTHDGGRTWTEIDTGLPSDAPVNVVREDPKRPGLLFCGTERQVFVSFDDGNHWQSLRLNMPASSVRDLTIKNDDLVAATHGRGFWILDDITPLRQIRHRLLTQPAHLFRPQLAWRVRWDTNSDTPLPPDTPAGKNPPDGAVINYYLRRARQTPVTLAIYDAAGHLVRQYASNAPLRVVNPAKLNIPAYWVRPPQKLSAAAGLHRFIWDLHYTPLPGPPNYPMQAVPHDTPPAYTSPYALPGRYTVRLTVAGHTYSQPLVLRMDPRVKTPAAGLAEQFRLSMGMYHGLQRLQPALQQVMELRAALKKLPPSANRGVLGQEVKAIRRRATALVGSRMNLFAMLFGSAKPTTLTAMRFQLSGLLNSLQQADVAPTTVEVASAARREQRLKGMLARWQRLRTEGLPELNHELRKAGLKTISLGS